MRNLVKPNSMTPHLIDTTERSDALVVRHRDLQSTHDPGSYVLVVDDESVVRDFLRGCLEESGYVVKQAASAAEALEMMVAKPASVVLVDITMPGQDGLWLAERLHAHWPQTAIIMAAAVDDLQSVHLNPKIGAAAYITKPIAHAELLQIVRRVSAPPSDGGSLSEDSAPSSQELKTPHRTHQTKIEIEAEYTLEYPVRCSACGERITTVKAVRLLRTYVNFTSTLPRRGRVIACPHCLAVIPAELTNF